MGVIQDLWRYSEDKKDLDKPMNLKDWLIENPQYDKNNTPTETFIEKRKHTTTINRQKSLRFDSE
jgi:hypothetical protein